MEKELPRGRKAFHLYELELSEEMYQQKDSKIKFEHLMSRLTEGIYETKLPPSFRALMELGNCIRPLKGKIPRHE